MKSGLPAERELHIIMKKTYGVCFGMLAMGLAVLGAPASSRAAGGSGGGTETVHTSEPATSAASSSPADLRQRIDALKAELADLNSELAARRIGARLLQRSGSGSPR